MHAEAVKRRRPLSGRRSNGWVFATPSTIV